MVAKDIGWKCKHCGGLNKHLELDLEFGKRRELVDCEYCGREALKLEEQQLLYAENEIVKVLRRDMEMLQGEKVDESAVPIVKGRINQLRATAKLFGLRDRLNEAVGVGTCLFCGFANNEDADRCERCGKKEWNDVPSIEEV